MTKLFITDKIDVYQKVKRLYELYFSAQVDILFSPKGKPFATMNGKIAAEKFNISHCEDFTVIGISTGEIGVDCERVVPVRTKHVLASLSPEERQEIKTDLDFYKNWTAKEAYTKYYGESIISTLKNLQFFGEALYHDGKTVKQNIIHVEYDGYLICVCLDGCKEFEIIKYSDI